MSAASYAASTTAKAGARFFCVFSLLSCFGRFGLREGRWPLGVRELREPRAVLLARKNGQDPSEITTRSQFDLSRDLQYEYKSSSLCCVEDLVKSLDTGEPPRKSAHHYR